MNTSNNHFFIEQFEKRLSEVTNAPYVVLCDSCTNAIFLTLKYLNIKQVTIPNHTYLSVPQAGYHANCKITFVDNAWEKYYYLTPNIIDAAVGLEPNMYIDNTFMCLSFQQKKTLNIGRGGAILCDSYEDYQILKRMAWDGRDSSIPVDQDQNIILGYHMYMPPDDAAKGILILNQLKNYKFGTYDDYPDVSKYFKGII